MDIADQIETIPSEWVKTILYRGQGPLPVLSVVGNGFRDTTVEYRQIVPGLWEYAFPFPLSYDSLDNDLRELIESRTTYGKPLFALLAQDVFIEKCWAPRPFYDDGVVLRVVGHRVV
jgi:hypothetical protein